MSNSKTPKMHRTLKVSLAFALALAAGCATTAEAPRASQTELDAQKALGAKAAGTIVWTSARAGVPHIFSMRSDGSDVQQLTKGDFTDWHPRFSPDGTKVLFARGRDEGVVSESAGSDGFDLYVVGADGRGVGKEVENGVWGSWISNDEILFQRGSKVMRTKLGSDEETVVVDTATLGMPAGTAFSAPRLSASGHLVAFTLGGAHREVGIWHMKKQVWSIVGEGSGIEWGPNDASVVWVGDDGRGFAEIDHVVVQHGDPVVAKKKTPKAEGESEGDDESDDKDAAKGNAADDGARLLDLPGARSREAFPRLSSDGKWLVFAAGTGGLANDLEPFELYLWEVGTPPESAARLTFDATNDRWPDLFIGGGAGGGPAAAPADAADDDKKTEAPAAKPTESEKTDDAEKAAKTDEAPAAEKAKAADDAEGDEFAPEATTAKPKAKAKGKKKKR